MEAHALRGQDEALGILHATLRSGHVGHSYLFHGPAGVGKTRAALEFARGVLCERPAADRAACGECGSCQAALALRHPDLSLLIPLPSFTSEGRTERQAEEARAEARGRVLDRFAKEGYFVPAFAKPATHTVEDLARAKQFLALTAQRDDGFKVLIVKRAEAMTPPAAHAFLKILEEPQPRRVLILCARQSRALLPTIASRCLQVRFRPLATEFVAGVVSETKGIAKATARLAAATSGGSLGRALQHFEPPIDATGKETPDAGELARLRGIAIDLFVRPKTAAILGPIRRARLDRDRTRFLAVVSLALHYYRDVLRHRIEGAGAPSANDDLREEIAADARALSTAALTRRLRLLEEIAAAAQSNVTVPYAVASAQHRMGIGVQ